MIITTSENLLLIENEKGTLVIEPDYHGFISMQIFNPSMALTMEAICTKTELKELLYHQEYYRMNHMVRSPFAGRKKVVESIFSSTHERSITCLSDDTTYQYPLTNNEWQEIMSLFSYIIYHT